MYPGADVSHYHIQIKVITIQYITDRKISILNKEFDNTFRVYNQAGLQIQTINGDTKLKPVEDTSKDIDIIMNSETAQEHVKKIKRETLTIK